jgi:ubiquitin-protein ligase
MVFSFFKDDDYVEIQPWEGRTYHLRVIIRGLENTPYENGKFVFEIRLTSNYPYSPPFCYCHTRIWHPNIDPSIFPDRSNICLDLINPDSIGKVDSRTGASGWTPSKRIQDVIESLKGMIHMRPPFWDPNSALNKEAGEMALQNIEKFIQIAREWTKRYAMG